MTDSVPATNTRLPLPIGTRRAPCPVADLRVSPLQRAAAVAVASANRLLR